MKVSEVLRAGKQALLDRGWCQGDEAAIGGSKCCAATALLNAGIPLSQHFDDFPGHRAMLGLKAAAGIQSTERLADWNDAPERTKEEVLAAYDKAITLAEQEESHVS